jgi:peptidoglycan/xylan/chitin deacetylase (PgdA/CDA1 family)
MQAVKTFFLCFLSVAALCPPVPAETGSLIVEHGPRESKKIALTFDACPTGKPEEYDDKVIDLLVRENVPATLFMSGRWVEKNPEKAKYLAGLPQFEIAAHSYYHPHMLEKTDERDQREFKSTQAVIRRVTGKTPRYFRPPYGEVDDRVAKLAAAAGLVTIQYDIPSGDPDPRLSAARIARSIIKNAKGGSIIVFHMNKNGVHTAEALPDIIRGLREKEFTLVTVGELLRQGKGTPMQARRTPEKKILPVTLKASQPAVVLSK